MKALVIEDENLAAERLMNLISEADDTIHTTGPLKSIESSVDWLRENGDPDLIFCDIELLDGQSFEIFDQVKVSCPIIFTTAYDQYAIQAFEVNGIAYLLKPINLDKLKSSLQKLETLSGNTENNLDLKKISDLIKSQEQHYKSRFLIKVGQKIRSIAIKDISYFFTKDKLTLLVTESDDKYPIDQALDDLEEVLDPKNFFRVNRKYLVKIEAISEIHPYFKGRVKLNLDPHIDDEIVVSSEKTPLFKAWLDQ